jgi:hypothetical protein
MNVNNKQLNPLTPPFVEKSIVLADYGFRGKEGVLENMKICKEGTWNKRICVETLFHERLETNSTQGRCLHSDAPSLCFCSAQCATKFVSLRSS